MRTPTPRAVAAVVLTASALALPLAHTLPFQPHDVASAQTFDATQPDRIIDTRTGTGPVVDKRGGPKRNPPTTPPPTDTVAPPATDTVAPPPPTDSTTLPPPPTDSTTVPPPPVGSGVSTSGLLQNIGEIPESSAWEPTGNFRTICGFSHFAYDDPIVYPNQPGASHLHMFFGNTSTNASSTYDSLRTTGDGSCQGGPLNRSGYWSPALHNASGNLLIPDFITVYYKGNGPSAAEIAGIRPFPAGLRMIAGYDMNAGGDQFGSAHFDWTCETTQHPQGTIPSCPAGERIGVRLSFPNCWDGVNLDSTNHRSHLAYGTWEGTGKWHCPAGYPVILPDYSIGIWYQNDGNSANWYLDSDRMPGMTHANGSTFHADWFGAWEPDVMNTWVSRCINGMLNCIDGEIGDGRKLVGGYTYTGPKVVAPIPRPG